MIALYTVVSAYIKEDALAAVGAANQVMNIIILGISGICIGSSVIMSSAFGAGDLKVLKKEMATTAVFGLYLSLLITALGILTARPLLQALKVPEQILGTASAYLAVTFLGASFTYFYNALSAALKSIGDSKMLGTFIQTSLRAVFVYLLIPRYGLNGVAIACAVGWSVMLMAEIPYFFHLIHKAGLKGRSLPFT